MQAKPASVAEYNYKARKTRHSTLRRRHDVVKVSQLVVRVPLPVLVAFLHDLLCEGLPSDRGVNGWSPPLFAHMHRGVPDPGIRHPWRRC